MDISSLCRGAVRKEKADLNLKLARDVKNQKQMFFKYISNEEKQKEYIGLLLNRRVNNSPAILNTMSYSKLPSPLPLQALLGPWDPWEPSCPGWYKTKPAIRGERVEETLQEPGPYTLMSPKDTYPSTLQGG